MNAPLIRGGRRTISASSLLKALGDDLAQIRQDDTLTWADMGRVLGKSEDQAAKYADGSAEMPVTSYLFAKREWGTRVTAKVTAMIAGSRSPVDDEDVLPELLGCANGLAEALRDGRICSRDLHINRKDIEDGIAALQGLLARLEAESA